MSKTVVASGLIILIGLAILTGALFISNPIILKSPTNEKTYLYQYTVNSVKVGLKLPDSYYRIWVEILNIGNATLHITDVRNNLGWEVMGGIERFIPVGNTTTYVITKGVGKTLTENTNFIITFIFEHAQQLNINNSLAGIIYEP